MTCLRDAPRQDVSVRPLALGRHSFIVLRCRLVVNVQGAGLLTLTDLSLVTRPCRRLRYRHRYTARHRGRPGLRGSAG